MDDYLKFKMGLHVQHKENNALCKYTEIYTFKNEPFLLNILLNEMVEHMRELVTIGSNSWMHSSG